jgi:type II pantothenate kinase
MLVSIGSGVSIIKVSDFSTFERVSGTMIGGGTLLGLSNLLTGIKDFDQILDLSKQGDNG